MQNLNFDLNILKPIFDFELFKVSQQDKEDVKQTALLRILTAAQDKTEEELPQDKLFSFAQTIVKRTVADHFRRLTRKVEINNTLVNFCDDVEEDSGAGGADAFSCIVFESGFDVADIRLDYHNNSHKFTPKERQVINFLLFNEEGLGMSMTEISAELGVDKARATYALKKLREVCADR